MSSIDWLHLLPLLVLLIVAAAIDLASRRIPNWLTVTIALTGLLQSLSPFHTCTIGLSVLGLLTGFVLMFGQFAVGGLGGGDVKLLMAVGAWVGPLPLLAIFAGASVIGLMIVICQAFWQRRMGRLLHNSALLAVNLIHLRQVGLDHARETGKSCKSIDRPLPYAVPVLLATIAAIYFKLLLAI